MRQGRLQAVHGGHSTRHGQDHCQQLRIIKLPGSWLRPAHQRLRAVVHLRASWCSTEAWQWRMAAAAKPPVLGSGQLAP